MEVTSFPVSSTTVACSTTSCTCFLKTNRPCSSLGAGLMAGPDSLPREGSVEGASDCCAEGGGGDVRGGSAMGFSEPGGGAELSCGEPWLWSNAEGDRAASTRATIPK